MPGLFSSTTPKSDPITDPAIDIANSVNDRNMKILENFLKVVIMLGIGSWLVMMMFILALFVVQIYRILRLENVKTVKISPRSPILQEGEKFFIEQKNGMIFEGVVTLNESNHYEIIIDEAKDQESVAIPSSMLEIVEMENDSKEEEREMRKAEEEYEYQRFMGRFSTENFASFVRSEEYRSTNENRA